MILFAAALLLSACSDEEDPAPVLAGVAPVSGPSAGGVTVTLSGSDFRSGARVTFDGLDATNIAFQNSSTLTCETPASAAGPAEVRVTNPDGQSSTLADAYTYIDPPSVTGVSPNHGPVAGGTSVTISGEAFQNGATIAIGGADTTGVTFVSTSTITCTTAPNAAGTADVVVTNPDSQTGTMAGGFTYDPAPTVASVTPPLGPAAGGTSVTIAGTNFVSGATVTFDGTSATGTSVVSPTSITCTTPPGSEGTADVVVTNQDLQYGTLSAGYTYYVQLTVTNSNPSNGQANVYLNDPLVLTFSSNIDSTTVGPFTVGIEDSQGASPFGSYSVSSNTVTFTPQYPPGFTAMTTYTVVINAPPASPALKSVWGGSMQATYTATFTTGSSVRPDITGPAVVSITPANGSTSVSRDTNVVITFSEPIDYSSAAAAFSLVDQANPLIFIAGTLTFSNNATVLNFDPEPAGPFPNYLAASANFTVALNSFLCDVAGNPLQSAPWSSAFSTGTTPSASSLRGPIVESFNDNSHENVSQTDAEWNTAVAGALAAKVQAQPVNETDPGPSANPTSAIQGPWQTTACRVAFLINASWLSFGASNLANKPLTRLFWKHSGSMTAAIYTGCIVRIGHTTLSSFPASVPPGTTFSSLYMQSTTQILPEVVARLANYQASAGGPAGMYVEIPIVGNFVYNGTDNIIIDIEVSGGSAQNLCSGDSQTSAGSPIVCRAYDNLGAYNTIQGTDNNAPYFMLEFDGHAGSAGLDGAGNFMTSILPPLGSGNDIYVTTNAVLDTSQFSLGYGLLKVRSVYVARGAVLTIIGPNPCIIRSSGLVRIDGTIRACGRPGIQATGIPGGAGGSGGPGGGQGGAAGAGVVGAGSFGQGGWGLDGQSSAASGAGSWGVGGTAGSGGGGGGCAVAGSQGQNGGLGMGGLGGYAWGSISSLLLHGGAGGGGGGGGSGTSGGGGGGGGGGGYFQILCDRNISMGSSAVIEARGGAGGGAAALTSGGGGGGGSGGAVFLAGLNLSFAASGGAVLNVQGGNGGAAASGGGGGGPQPSPPYNQPLADGRIRIDAAVSNQSGATFVPSVTVNTGRTLSGIYASPSFSTANSTFYDTGCSAPQYTSATVSYSTTVAVTQVYVNFIGADPDILSQPNVSPTNLYPTAELLPAGLSTATVTLGGAQAGYINASPASQTGTSLNGLRFISLRINFFTTSGTTTPQVTQVSIQYQY